MKPKALVQSYMDIYGKRLKMEFVNNTNISTELPKKLRAKQVAENFGIGLSTVWLYAKEGKLTPINISPRVTVFDTAEVLKLFNGLGA